MKEEGKKRPGKFTDMSRPWIMVRDTAGNIRVDRPRSPVAGMAGWGQARGGMVTLLFRCEVSSRGAQVDNIRQC